MKLNRIFLIFLIGDSHLQLLASSPQLRVPATSSSNISPIKKITPGKSAPNKIGLEKSVIVNKKQNNLPFLIHNINETVLVNPSTLVEDICIGVFTLFSILGFWQLHSLKLSTVLSLNNALVKNFTWDFSIFHYILIGNILYGLISFFVNEKKIKRIMFLVGAVASLTYAFFLCKLPETYTLSENLNLHFKVTLIRLGIAIFSTSLMCVPLLFKNPKLSPKLVKNFSAKLKTDEKKVSELYNTLSI